MKPTAFLLCFFAPFIAVAGEASYCVFSQLTPGVPGYVDIYKIDEQPCLVTQVANKAVRLEDESVRRQKGPIVCSPSTASCTARNEYFLDKQDKPFVVIFRAPKA